MSMSSAIKFGVIVSIGTGIIISKCSSKASRVAPDIIKAISTPQTSLFNGLPNLRKTTPVSFSTIDELLVAKNIQGQSPAIHLASIFPINNSTYENMFPNTVFSNSAQSDMNRFAFASAQYGEHAKLITDSHKKAEVVFNELFSTMSNTTIIISGHSIGRNAGRMLVMPSGELIDIAYITEIARQYDKQFVLLSCYSEDLSLQRAISFKEASSYIGDLRKLDPDANWEQTIDFLVSRIEKTDKRKTKMLLAAGGTGIGTASTYVYMEFEDN